MPKTDFPSTLVIRTPCFPSRGGGREGGMVSIPGWGTNILHAVCGQNKMTLMIFFPEQITLKFVWKHKRPQIAKTVLRKQNRAGGNTLPALRLHRLQRL